MVRFFLAAGLMIAASGCVHRAPQVQHAPFELADVVAAHVQARGGADRLDRVRSMAIGVEIREGKMALEGRYAATVDGQVRVDVFADGKRVFSEGIDDEGLWSRSGDGDAEPGTATGAKNALLHGAEDKLFGWHRFDERGHILRLLSPQEIDGTRLPVVEVRYRTGHVSYFYLDPESWLVVRKRDERAYHPDLDPTKIRVESRFSGSRLVDDIQFHEVTTDVNLDSGEVIAVNRVKQRFINPSLCNDYFDRKRSGPALLDEPDPCWPEPSS